MYSKPKKYVKQRDKVSRRISPRTSDDSAYKSDAGTFSPNIDVENYGDGEITADSVPQWPQNFEQEETGKQKEEAKPANDEPKPGTSTSMEQSLHEKAQKYMVKKNSIRELTGAKFITVPEPKDQPERLRYPRTASVRGYGNIESIQAVSDGRPMKIPGGTIRAGAGYALPQTQGHYATLRVHHRRHHNRHGKLATVKAIPKETVVRSVKGYHMGNNVTVRGHNTGHAVRQLKQVMKSWDQPDGTFKRTTVLSERKEYFITRFAIELDQADLDVYMPGDFLSGRIILESSSDVEIRFVELLIVGLASVHFAKNDPNLAKNSQEVVLNKRSYVMGTPDGRWNSVITAGKYVSKFKFRLPDNLPASIKYEDKEHGFTFEVAYLVKVRICDEMGSASARSTHSTNNYVKVLLTRRFPFFVKRPFDIHSIPNSLQPVTHSEFVNLGCLPILIDSTSLTLSLDRSVFLAGDEIRIKLSTNAKTAKRIRSLTCELHQNVFSSIKTRQNFTVIQIHESQPEGFPYNQGNKSYILFEFIVPTHSQFIPSYLPGCGLLKVSYTVMLTVVFKSCSGQLFLECPVAIGPSASPTHQASATTMVPVFIRPKRFPIFTRDSHEKQRTQNGALATSTPRPVPLVSNLNASKSSGFPCC
ncbi:uncharacterized protein LOC128211281 [Mya arenaria]|uniref:uncharacterized protein LOC128211281 n=1 Tax=Mya arenaria TaxID=6604 RepID=UPI0022E70C40|nr:uncharacterized protein LOC128211281 [Mya arenaria]XP_052771857.1 uncharacterized protein LOC128211281 [Mya arenaria]XP_052771858.1 uncharacterized protein LOC128211281 [Mya arenaria]XP_052771859.1 uncharacterized protein LOC128211281 [Mya arenaria]XP_052771860.1 uncharacterized protein LOC128211281 [Mya arenaria]